MVRIDSSFHVSEGWTYAFIGGVASIPLTIGLYWLSGMGSEFSLNMVFFGGILAGYLASVPSPETDYTSVGFRAGVIGGLPGLWLLVDLVEAAIVWSSPLWFRIVAVPMLAIVFTTLLLGLSGLVGLLGGKVGGWLATKTGRQTTPVARN
jgi:hypothetical protein